MSNLAETRATNKEVLSLARTIKAEQAPEIEQMKSWLKAAGQSEMGMEDHMGMGMLTEEEITALEKAKGKEGQTTDGKMGVDTKSLVGGKVR